MPKSSIINSLFRDFLELKAVRNGLWI